MYESYFSYNLTRPYPFRWLTCTVVIGGIIATAIFSFLNLASNSYEIVATETSDPNSTVAQRNMYSSWPSILSAKSRPSCESRTLSVGISYYTTNTALPYLLENIWQVGEDGTTQQSHTDLAYWNNPLDNCKIPELNIVFEGLDRNALYISVQRWGAAIQAKIFCNMTTSAGRRSVQLATSYTLDGDLGKFPGRNETRRASLWWGESLLAWYYVDLTRRIGEFSDGVGGQHKAHMYFKPNSNVSRAEDYKAERFLNLSGAGNFSYFSVDTNLGILYISNISAHDIQHFLPAAKAYVISFYSTIMADLGQRNVSNILNDTSMLEYFSSNITRIASEKLPDWTNLNHNSFPDLAAWPMSSSNSSNWHLEIRSSTISTTYLCQVPRLKSTGNLIFSIVVADLVLLQALWKVFIIVVDWWTKKRYPHMGTCTGCSGSGSIRSVPEDRVNLLRESGFAK